MKHLRYILPSLLLSVFLSCTEKQLSDAEILAGRDVTALEVRYAVAGTPVGSLNFTSGAAVKTVEVDLNSEHLKWNIESNREWCVVRSEEHEGSGSFTLEISANEDFEARDEATLTFVAGEFRGFRLKVNQNGGAFIISQPWFVSGKDGGTFEVLVTTEEEAGWDVEPSSWLSAVRKSVQTTDGYATTTLSLAVAPNDGTTRYGTLGLVAGNGEKAEIAVSQIGTEYAYDTDGTLWFPDGEKASLTLLAPEYIIDSFIVPDYVTASWESAGDGTVRVTLLLSENLSDCSEIRESELYVKLSNLSVSTVAIPSIRQGYIPAHGLLTAKGVQRFAAAVAAGEDTSDWEKDGVVNLAADIDLGELTGWEGIGTDAHPFTGRFDGAGHTILNLRRSLSGFFHRTEDATVTNLSIGKDVTVYRAAGYDADVALGGLVDEAVGTLISGCSFAGDLEFASVSSDEFAAYVGGIAGRADARSRIVSCKTTGSIAITSRSDPDVTLYAGGIAGVSGETTRCEFGGSLSFTSGIGHPLLGGILAFAGDDAIAGGNSFLGTITLGGSASDIAIGGLYAAVGGGQRVFDNAVDKSVSMGRIEIGAFSNAAATRLFAGGMVGLAGSGSSLTFRGYELMTNFLLDHSASRTMQYCCIGGALGGTEPLSDGTLLFEDMVNRGSLTVSFGGGGATITGEKTLIGGLAALCSAALTVRGCINEGSLGIPSSTLAKAPYTANKANYMTVVGGLVAAAEGGDAVFSKCENKAVLYNHQYNNRYIPAHKYNNHWCSNVTAGILGVFDYYPSHDGSRHLEMTSCSNSGDLQAFRGLVAGIVGYAAHATLKDCNATGSLDAFTDSNASHKGGIAAVLDEGSVVEDCTAQLSLKTSNPGGAYGSPGGVVSTAIADLSLRRCAWFGVCSGTEAAGLSFFGGLLGTGTGETIVEECKFGGSVQNIPVSENNLQELAIGNGVGQLKSVAYWNGN